MQLGMIGLGRMGANMVRRLQRAGHACVVYDRNRGAVAGAFLLRFVVPTELFDVGFGGIPSLGDDIAVGRGIVIEAVTTHACRPAAER